MVRQLPAPHLAVTGIAALEENHQGRSLEAAGHVTRMHALTHLFGKLRQHFFRFDDPDLLLHFGELVDLHVGEYVQSGLGLALQALAETFDELGTMVEEGRRIALEGIVDEGGGFLLRIIRRRDAHVNARHAVEIHALKLELEFTAGADVEMRFDLEFLVPGPFALDGGIQCALQRRVALGSKAVHERKPLDLVHARILEQLEPGIVRLDHDALVGEGDSRRRRLHVVANLALVFAGRRDRRIQGTLGTQCPKLACDDRLQSIPEANRHEVAGAVAHGLLDRVLVDFLAQCDHGDFRVEAVFLLDDPANSLGVTVAIDDYQFDLLGRQRVVELAGPIDPVTMGSMAAVAERAVDECHVVLVLGQHGDRDAVAVVQCAVLACLRASFRVSIFC